MVSPLPVAVPLVSLNNPANMLATSRLVDTVLHQLVYVQFLDFFNLTQNLQYIPPPAVPLPCFERHANRQAECLVPSDRLTSVPTLDDCLDMCAQLATACVGVQYSEALEVSGSGWIYSFSSQKLI